MKYLNPMTIICRCCGQIMTDNLFNMRENVRLKDGPLLWDWFIKFNDFQATSLNHKNGHICSICLKKLVLAYKFHRQCLAVDQMFQAEVAEADVEEPIDTDTMDMEPLFPDKLAPASRKRKRKQNPANFYYVCEICGETVLKEKRRTHNGAHKLECEICQKSFLSRLDLQQHVNLVHGKKLRATVEQPLVKCDICAKTMTQKSLRIHVLEQHRATKDKLCPMCGKRFLHARDLQWHVFKHSNPYPFECAHCGSKFGSKDRMKNHLRKVHERMRFNCEKCGSKFIKMTALKHHTLLQHDGAKLRCQVCNIDKFISISTLRIHLKKCHNLTYDQRINFVLANNEILMRNRASIGTLIQTRASIATECEKV